MRNRHAPFHCLSVLAFAGLPISIHFDRPDPPTGDPPSGGGGGGGSGNPDLDRAKAELEQRDKQIADLNAKITELGQNVVSKEDKAELAKLKREKEEAEKKRLAEQGELQKLLDKANEELRASRAAAEEADKRAKKQVQDLRLSNLFDREIPKSTEIPISQVIGALGLRDYFVFNEQTEGFKIVDPVTKTTPRNANGTEMTPEEFIAKKIADTPWIATVKPKGGSGSGNATGGGTGAGGEFTSEDVREMSIADFNKNKDKIFATADRNTRPSHR